MYHLRPGTLTLAPNKRFARRDFKRKMENVIRWGMKEDAHDST